MTRSNRKSQTELAAEYRSNPYLIQTAYGIIDAQTAPGTVRMLSEKDITPIGLCILDVVRNRFPGIRTTGNCLQGGSIIVRGPGSIGNARVAIFDIDGQIFTDVPLWLDVNSIKRIAIISSMASASDHIDHVRTQLPYALFTGILTAIFYLILGFILS